MLFYVRTKNLATFFGNGGFGELLTNLVEPHQATRHFNGLVKL